ncbi:MAG: M42 family metallopeptidase [Ruminococcus sp.]|jgi:endoglucanase|nr:M42 family metallopeptidase [Ruminococcus sp.]
MNMNIKLLETLCNLNGGSGDEGKIREFIYEKIKKNADEIRVDNLGNLIAFKKGTGNNRVRLTLTAHMDEVSFIVTSYRDDGTVRFAPVGGINADSVLGRRVISNGLTGVIGSKAIHNMTEKEQQKAADFDDFSIDFGFADKAECQEKISLGDRVYFEENFILFGNEMVASKAIDDRFGCAILISLIEKNFPCDVTFAFLTQEEVGCRGAKALDIDVDIAIVIETTTAADFDGVLDDKKCTRINEGAVVTFMDHGTIYDKNLYELTRKIATENGIKTQTKTLIAGGNDASALYIKNGGIKTIAISIPCRYLHTANCVASLSDMEMVEKLAEKMIKKCTE